MFKIAKQMTTKKQVTIAGDKCVRNDRGDFASTDFGKHSSWKEDYQSLLNDEFHWNKENWALITLKSSSNWSGVSEKDFTYDEER